MSQHVPTVLLRTCSPYLVRFIVLAFKLQQQNSLYAKQMSWLFSSRPIILSKTLSRNSRTLKDRCVLTGMSACLSTFTGSSRNTMESSRKLYSDSHQRCEEVTFQANASIYFMYFYDYVNVCMLYTFIFIRLYIRLYLNVCTKTFKTDQYTCLNQECAKKRTTFFLLKEIAVRSRSFS